MKILELRFKNLNSLAGEWKIDLTHPSYCSDGIFAITGPTGAGKSTILDAVCLGLYGRTPRLKEINQSQNEIMSRHTGDCFSEVLFESKAGRFRCHWAQHRAYKKADGNLAPSTHEIATEDGTLIESKKRAVAGVVEKKTGMDFDQFTRSMLLAQGDFAAFLDAGINERAPILEQITGTRIYSDISIAAHDRLRLEKDRLDQAKAACDDILVLTPDEERELQETLKTHEAHHATWLERQKTIQEILEGHQRIESLQKECERLENEANRIDEAQTDFLENRQKLARAIEAATLDAPYALLKEGRQQLMGDEAALERITQRIPAAKKALHQATEALSMEENAFSEEKKRAHQEQGRIQQVILKDAAILDLQKKRDDIHFDIEHLTEQRKETHTQKNKLESEIKTVSDKLTQIDDDLEENAIDAGLIEILGTMETEIDALEKIDHDLEKDQSTIENETEALQKISTLADKNTSQLKKKHAELAAATARHREHSQTLEATLQGETPQQLRLRLEQITDRCIRLDRLFDLLRTLQTSGQSLMEKHREKSQIEKDMEALISHTHSMKERVSQAEERVDHLQTELELRCRIESLEAHREGLREGHPCPLCGALDHPFAENTIPRADETRTALTSAKKERDTLLKTLNQQLQEKSALKKEMEHAQRSIQTLNEMIRIDQGTIIALCAELQTQNAPQPPGTNHDAVAIDPAKLATLGQIDSLDPIDDTKQPFRSDLIKALTLRTTCLKERADHQRHSLNQRLNQADQLAMTVKSAQKTMEKAQEALGKVQKKEDEIRFDEKECQGALERAQKKVEEQNRAFLEVMQSILHRAAPYDHPEWPRLNALASEMIKALPSIKPGRQKEPDIIDRNLHDRTLAPSNHENNISLVLTKECLHGLNEMIQGLKKRKTTFKKREEERTTLSKTVTEHQTSLREVESRDRWLEENRQKQENERSKTIARLTQIREERHALYGDKDPEMEWKKITDGLDATEKKLTRLRDDREGAKEALQKLENDESALTRRIADNKTRQVSQMETFDGLLRTHRFKDETDYLACCLPSNMREALETRQKAIDTRQSENRAQWEVCQQKLAVALEERKTKWQAYHDDIVDPTSSPADLKKSLTDIEEKRRDSAEMIGALKQKQRDNQAAQSTHKERRKALLASQSEYGRWKNLHDLIGSSDGKRFRNFAQGLTFEVMLSHANRRLTQMSDRYFLIQHDTSPLELNVVDNYQGGEIRSTRNLSGGERFIVSLSLALGLSAMSSRNVRVDSLFLDEGFGTLDDEALETALFALSTLHQEDKLIGIISHVSALKERIGTQISVTPLSGGRSRLTGPGCKAVKRAT